MFDTDRCILQRFADHPIIVVWHTLPRSLEEVGHGHVTVIAIDCKDRAYYVVLGVVFGVKFKMTRLTADQR